MSKVSLKLLRNALQKKNDKVETSTFLASLISMRYKVKEMQKVPYASTIGSLMYAQVYSHSNLAYNVGMLGRYLSNLGLDHW